MHYNQIYPESATRFGGWNTTEQCAIDTYCLNTFNIKLSPQRVVLATFHFKNIR